MDKQVNNISNLTRLQIAMGEYQGFAPLRSTEIDRNRGQNRKCENRDIRTASSIVPRDNVGVDIKIAFLPRILADLFKFEENSKMPAKMAA